MMRQHVIPEAYCQGEVTTTFHPMAGQIFFSLMVPCWAGSQAVGKILSRMYLRNLKV